MSAPLNEQSIAVLVDTFYARVRKDDVIGPVFNRVVADWPEHLAKLKDFWSSVVLSAGTYKGNPMMAHLPIPEMDHRHLERWLSLWDLTLSEIYEPDIAEIFLGKAIMVGERFVAVSTHMRNAQLVNQ